MSLFSFLRSVGGKLGRSDGKPKAEDLKRTLDSHNTDRFCLETERGSWLLI